MTVNLTFESVVAFAKEAAAEKPEGYIYINPSGQVASPGGITCDYWDDSKDAPSCIVGVILHKAGVSATNITEGRSAFASSYLARKAEGGVITISDKAATFLFDVQMRQDVGVPWSKAIEASVAETERLHA